MKNEVTLAWSEVLIATNVGIMRQIQNLRDKRNDRYGCDPENGWTIHIEGACGEMAVAKLFRKFWSGAIGNLKADDVDNYQVRTTSKENYRLIIHPKDADDKAFILAIGLAPTYNVVGWIFGRDAKQEKFWCDPTCLNRHAFFVPQSELRPLDELEIC